MIDLHSHSLPGLDDGAADVGEAEKMLISLREQGVDTVCFTPHYYPRKEPLAAFLERRAKAVEAMRPAIERVGLRTFVASEVHYSDTLMVNDDLSALCIEGTDYLMLEMPFDVVRADWMIEKTVRLSSKYSVLPILVHPERYPKLFNEPFLLEARRVGCLLQFDIEGLRPFFTRRKLLKFLEKGLITLTGSDAHDLDSRRANFDELARHLPPHVISQLMEKAEDVLANR